MNYPWRKVNKKLQKRTLQNLQRGHYHPVYTTREVVERKHRGIHS